MHQHTRAPVGARMKDKLKPNLAEQLAKAPSSELVDVVVELRPEAESSASAGAGAARSAPAKASRAELIAAKKAAFERSLAGVEEAVRKAGGQITERAWINQTVRARVPAAGVKELCRHHSVAAVGAATRLSAEGG